MASVIKMSPSTQKSIAEYFNGDDSASVYNYRSGTYLVEMYENRFGTPNLVAGPSRWTLCVDTMDYLVENGRINEFFTTMLSLRNVSKELKETNQALCASKRKDAIEYLNRFLIVDDLELIEFGNELKLHHIDDESDLVGSGGFANVYRVPGTNMVVKKLKDQFKDNDGIVSRFKQEFYLIHEKLRGIEGIIEGFEYNADDVSYTMEYCNCDLRDYIYKTHLDEAKRVDLILEILGIMSKVHERKVLHRDLSPKNIFIKEGHPIIADFGLGKAIDDNGRTYVTIDTSCNGTLEYCDPRQFQGLGFADEQSDIYSLGRIVNYVMTGDSDNFKHTLTIVSTIATEASLDARYHSVQEMIDKTTRLTKSMSDTEYANRCRQLLQSGYYDKTMDEYLFSFDDDDLLTQLNNANFRRTYTKVATSISYNEIIIEKFTSLRNIFRNPLGHTFALFDDVSNFCVDILKDHQNITPALKSILGECIYEITVGVNRWAAQSYFKDHYQGIETIYIQDTIAESEQWR